MRATGDRLPRRFEHAASRRSIPITASVRGRTSRRIAPVRVTRTLGHSSGHGGTHVQPRTNRRTSAVRVALRRLLAVAIPAALFSLALLQCLDRETTTSFHPDEARWLSRAHFVTELKNPFGPTWEDYYVTRGQPPLGSYLMGIGLLAQGRDTVTNAVWDFGYDESWNSFNKAMPVAEDLLAGRRTNAVVAALVVVTVYLIGVRLVGRVGATAGALFLAFHPLHIHLGSQALSDQLLCLMLALAFLAAFWFGNRPDLGRAILLGTFLGLGGATKLSPLLLSVPLAVLGTAYLIGRFRQHGQTFWKRRDSRTGLLLMIQPLVAFGVFVAVSPFLWPDPIGRTYALFEFRRIEMVGQGTRWPSVAVASPTAALSRIGSRLNETSSTTTRFQEVLGEVFAVSFSPIGFDLLMVCIGGLLLLLLVIRRGVFSPHGLVSVLLAGELTLIVLGMGSDFYRYYLPIVFISAVLVSVFADAVWKSAMQLVGRSRLSLHPHMTLSPLPTRSREPASASTSESM